jgi:hypothetical protein
VYARHRSLHIECRPPPWIALRPLVDPPGNVDGVAPAVPCRRPRARLVVIVHEPQCQSNGRHPTRRCRGSSRCGTSRPAPGNSAISTRATSCSTMASTALGSKPAPTSGDFAPGKGPPWGGELGPPARAGIKNGPPPGEFAPGEGPPTADTRTTGR